MRLLCLSKPLYGPFKIKTNEAEICSPYKKVRYCSCRPNAILGLSVTRPLFALGSRGPKQEESAWRIQEPANDLGHRPKFKRSFHRRGNSGKKKGSQNGMQKPLQAPYHRVIDKSQSLFTTHSSSPGAPFLKPEGARIFQKLVSFLRAQYPTYGFQEVITPSIYKNSLWDQSGYWKSYKDAIVTVKSGPSQKPAEVISRLRDGRMQGEANVLPAPSDVEQYSLKPMNCPGHCLLFQSERRSYKDLPIRYAEFSSLHRDEVSAALSGMTRVREFHQDDGHIFCRPSQVKEEIAKSLAFIQMVYDTLKFREFRLVLSTRPKEGYIGTLEEWDRAESQLKAALDENEELKWSICKVEGAFYGPKIDVLMRDSDGKEHQTGTIQLDFQLPKRFELAYESPAAELEAQGKEWTYISRSNVGIVRPVIVHRAIFGSLERFMALLLEHHGAKLPFWLSLKQITILTVNSNEYITNYANNIKNELMYGAVLSVPKPLALPLCSIDVDARTKSIAQKIVDAKKKNYSIILMIGQRNVAKNLHTADATMDMDPGGISDQTKVWSLINDIKPGSQAPLKKDRSSGGKMRGTMATKLNLHQMKRFIRALMDGYY